MNQDIVGKVWDLGRCLRHTAHWTERAAESCAELLRLSRFSRVRLCATPEMAAHQASPSLGFSRQEHWSGLPFPSSVDESEKWKWSRSVVSDSSRPHGPQLTRLLCPWDFQARVLEWVAIAFSEKSYMPQQRSKCHVLQLKPGAAKQISNKISVLEI